MSTIALVTANRVSVVESVQQKTLVAAEAITAGAPVRIDTNGKFTNSNGTTTTENDAYGVATKTVAAGEALTAIKTGVMDGWDLSGLAYNARVYISDTDGRLDTAAGTQSKIAGRVLPGTSTTLGTAYDKVLGVEL